MLVESKVCVGMNRYEGNIPSFEAHLSKLGLGQREKEDERD